MNRSDSPATVGERRGSRRIFLIILVICLLPPVAAYVLYRVRPEWLLSGAKANHGQLIQPTRPLPPLDLRGAGGAAVPASAFKGHWSLIVLGGRHCGDACIRRAVEVANIRPLLRDQSQRLAVFYLAPDAAALQEMQRALPQDAHQLRPIRWGDRPTALPRALAHVPGSVIMLDPLSDGVLSYAPDATPKSIYLDLKRLLRYSHIG